MINYRVASLTSTFYLKGFSARHFKFNFAHVSISFLGPQNESLTSYLTVLHVQKTC